MIGGKTLVQNHTYFGSNEWLEALRAAGKSPDSRAVVVNGKGLAHGIEKRIWAWRVQELKFAIEAMARFGFDDGMRQLQERLQVLEENCGRLAASQPPKPEPPRTQTLEEKLIVRPPK